MKYFLIGLVSVLAIAAVIFDTWSSVVGFVSSLICYTFVEVRKVKNPHDDQLTKIKSDITLAMAETKKLALKLGFRT